MEYDEYKVLLAKLKADAAEEFVKIKPMEDELEKASNDYAKLLEDYEYENPIDNNDINPHSDAADSWNNEEEFQRYLHSKKNHKDLFTEILKTRFPSIEISRTSMEVHDVIAFWHYLEKFDYFENEEHDLNAWTNKIIKIVSEMRYRNLTGENEYTMFGYSDNISVDEIWEIKEAYIYKTAQPF